MPRIVVASLSFLFLIPQGLLQPNTVYTVNISGADTTIAAMEGAAVLCRSARSLEPLYDVANQLEFLIKAKEFVMRFGVPTLNA